MNIVGTVTRNMSVKRVALNLSYSAVFVKGCKSDSRRYSRRELSTLTGYESTEKWMESLPLRFGVSSKTIKVISEPQEMYRIIMVGLYFDSKHLILQMID